MPSAATPYQPYGSAIYRRELSVRLGPGRAIGELIDDFHHFRASIEHDGARVTAVTGEALRHPWATCAGSVVPLGRLVGMPLDPAARAAARFTSSHLQCTHLFDAASYAIARAARGAGDVVYSIAVPDRVAGRTCARLLRDRRPLLEWKLRGLEIESPKPYAGRSIGAGLADWAEGELDVETASAVLALQRACVISGGRALDLERFARADQLPSHPMGRCHTYQLGTVERGFRMSGTVRNLTHVEDLRAASLSASSEI
jgi:hypothetical protein